MNYIGNKIPNSFFDYIGLPEEEVLKILPLLSEKSLLILEKRFGYDLKSGDVAKLENKLTKMENDYIARFIVPKILNNYKKNSESISNPIIVEHNEQVKKVLNTKNEYYKLLKENFGEYYIFEVNGIIIHLMREEGVNYSDGIEVILNYTKKNIELIKKTIENLSINMKEETGDMSENVISSEKILWEILQSVRDNFWDSCSLEDLIKATKIAMLKSGFKNYDNFVEVLEYLLNHRFNVFRILKSNLIENTNILITTSLTYSLENGDINIHDLVEKYYELADEGYFIDDIRNILTQEFKISQKLVMEILFNRITDLEFPINEEKRSK